MLDTAVCSDRFREIHGVLAKMKRNHEHLFTRTFFALHDSIDYTNSEKSWTRKTQR